MTDPLPGTTPTGSSGGEGLELARRLYRGLEMQAEIMRDPKRTGGWAGASNVANAFARQAERAKELHALLAQPSCTASPDHADIMETIANADADWQAKGYTSALAEVRDMANVGRALMEALPDGYCYMDCPSEIVSDLINERDEARTPKARDTSVDGEPWQSADTAPKDGTLLELVVDYTNGSGPLMDAIRACTVGWNTLADTGEDKWHFFGWDWCHDYIRAGEGEVIAWRPSRLNACDDELPSLPSRAALAEGSGS